MRPLDFNYVAESQQRKGPNRAKEITGRKITRREAEVLDLLKAALSNRDIGIALDISHHTVHNILRSAFWKLDAGNRTEAVVIWMERKAA